MDQEKIGKFIAERRKNNKLTQEMLAERLGVSINAVSKWERGLCLMDMSLLKPLSEILDVSVNELLAGEKITESDFKIKADENIIKVTELYDLKAIKKGTVGFTIIILFLLIYFAKNDMNNLPILIIWFVYNMIYTFNKYQYTKEKKNLIYALLYGVVTFLLSLFFFI